jgi:hypothetical protein
MRTRSVGFAAVIMAALSLVAGFATGQSRWSPPRTPWGDPDLQGFFTNKDEQGIPFERPAGFGDRKFVTEEEFAARLARAKQQLESDVAEFDAETADRSPAQIGFTTGPPPYWNDRGNPSRRSSLVIDPLDGKIPSVTPEGQRQMDARAAARVAARRGRGPADSWEDFSLFNRCISRGLPGSMLPSVYGNSYQIIQGPGFVGIRYEMVHETRIIPLDGRPRLGPHIRQYMGDARGRWEGNTLVVETTNFRPELVYRNANADTLRLIERFTRTAPDKVEWSVTVSDSSTWTKPWTFAVSLTQDASQPVFEFACHEGNYAMTNLLSVARAEEKAAEGVSK